MNDFHFLDKITAPAEIQTSKRVPELVRVPEAGQIRGIVLCDGLFALKTHWNGRVRQLCQGEGLCELHDSARLLVSYLIAVWDEGETRPLWVELTPKVGQALLVEADRLKRPLFGLVVAIKRQRKHAKAPIVITVDPYARVEATLRQPMTPEETIARVFESSDSPCARAKRAV